MQMLLQAPEDRRGRIDLPIEDFADILPSGSEPQIANERDVSRSLDALPEGQRKVVLKAPDLKALGLLKEKALREGLVAVLVKDAGLTEVEPGTVTVLGIGPAPDEAVDKVTGQLPLY